MCENNRAIVIVKAGRADFADAMERGIIAGRAIRLDERKRQEVEAEIDRQAIEKGMQCNWKAAARGVKVAIGRNLGAKDYANMCFDAEMDYGESFYEEGRLHRAARKALGVYGLLVMAVAAAYRAQDKVLEP